MIKGLFKQTTALVFFSLASSLAYGQGHNHHKSNPHHKHVHHRHKISHSKARHKSNPPHPAHHHYNLGKAQIVFFSGIGWISAGKTELVDLGGLTTNRYQAITGNTKGPLTGFSVGRLWNCAHHNLWGSLNVEVSYNRAIKTKGGIVQPLFLQNPNFDTLDYSYAVSSTPLSLIAQIGVRGKKHGLYYITGGPGVSWNRAAYYHEVPTNPGATANPMRSMFRQRTITAFAWTAGAGIMLPITKIAYVGLEYRYSDFGYATFGTFPGQATGDTLSLGHVTANSLIARLTVVRIPT